MMVLDFKLYTKFNEKHKKMKYIYIIKKKYQKHLNKKKYIKMSEV
jgi:hypothetical protein